MIRASTLLLVLATGAGVARADAAPAAPHAVVVHVAPLASAAGAPIELDAMIDAPFAERLAVRWRAIGEPGWHDVAFERSSAGGWFASLPAAAPPGLEYYIVGTDAAGAELAHFASSRAPHVVRVEPSLVDQLEALDRRRLGELPDEVALDVTGHDFGNRYGLADRFLRGELIYRHRFLRVLHSVGFGFGAIAGQTPEASDPGSRVLDHGLRYGFGELVLRVHPSVFVDARLGLGVSHAGFEQNARAAITLGKPWRSNLQLGAELLGDLGPSAWVRLQWDTAPPLLMAASVVRTDLPGAVLSRVGLYLAYDVAYRVLDRLTVRAQLSYGPRDGTAHLGGGLGTSIAF